MVYGVAHNGSHNPSEFYASPTLPYLLTSTQQRGKKGRNKKQRAKRRRTRLSLAWYLEFAIPTGSHSPDHFLGNVMPISTKEDDAPKKTSSPMSFKKLLPKILRTKSMKNLFKSKKPRPPPEIVRDVTRLLSFVDSDSNTATSPRRNDKLAQLDADIREMKSILYGIEESEPVAEACAQLTQEFFAGDTMRLLIRCLPKLNFETRKDATRVVANLQRQPVHSRLIASDYLEKNIDLLDVMITGHGDPSVALHYGGMLRDCLRHQVVASYVLKSAHMKKFFDYIQLPNFDVASDAAATFKELMTRHKSTVAEFLTENYTWFFSDFNSKLLESPNYMTRRQAIKLLGDMLLDRSNSGVMVRYVSSKNNMKVLMNLMRETHKCIQIDAFHVFKLFVANKNKPADIVNILAANRNKLLRFFDDFNTEKEDEMFAADKAQVVKEIRELVATAPVGCSGELFKPIAGQLEQSVGAVHTRKCQ